MNGAFRPKGGNGVHGLCDDAGDVGCADRGVTRRKIACAVQEPLSQRHRTLTAPLTGEPEENNKEERINNRSERRTPYVPPERGNVTK